MRSSSACAGQANNVQCTHTEVGYNGLESIQECEHDSFLRPLIIHRICDVKPDLYTVTFPFAEGYRRLAAIDLYCLVTEANGCEQLAQSC